jgi:hypothetical protein
MKKDVEHDFSELNKMVSMIDFDEIRHNRTTNFLQRASFL